MEWQLQIVKHASWCDENYICGYGSWTWREEASSSFSPLISVSPLQAWQTQPSKREADAGYWLSCSFTPMIERLGYPQCTVAYAAIASPPLTLQRRGPAFSITSLCRPAWRAVEVVSQRSVCCAHWKEADYFPAMVHWLCRLDKNEDTSYWANELDRYIKAKILFLSSNVSPPPEVGPSIWGLQNHLKPKYARAGFRLDEHFNLLAEE